MSGSEQTTSTPGGSPPPPPPANGAAPPGGEPRTYTVTDERSAGEAIAGLLFGASDETPPAPGDSEQSAATPAAETGAQETAPTEGDDQGQGEQSQTAAAIEPPVSWTADEKQAFGQLPPALQQTIARRESQREAVLTQRSQEAAESRRAFEAERTAAVGLRTEFLTGLQKMLLLAAPEAAALNNVDWVAVQAQSPAEYTRLQAMRDSLRSRLTMIEQEFQQQAAQVQHVQRQALAQLVEREGRALHEKMPDFGDAVKGPQLRSELGVYLRDVGGFTPDEINQAYDHRLVVMAHKAMLYDRQNAARASADTKRNNVPAQVAQPGSTAQPSGDRGPGQALKDKVNRLGRTNSVRDAGSLIAELL